MQLNKSILFAYAHIQKLTYTEAHMQIPNLSKIISHMVAYGNVMKRVI